MSYWWMVQTLLQCLFLSSLAFVHCASSQKLNFCCSIEWEIWLWHLFGRFFSLPFNHWVLVMCAELQSYVYQFSKQMCTICGFIFIQWLGKFKLSWHAIAALQSSFLSFCSSFANKTWNTIVFAKNLPLQCLLCMANSISWWQNFCWTFPWHESFSNCEIEMQIGLPSFKCKCCFSFFITLLSAFIFDLFFFCMDWFWNIISAKCANKTLLLSVRMRDSILFWENWAFQSLQIVWVPMKYFSKHEVPQKQVAKRCQNASIHDAPNSLLIWCDSLMKW